MADLVYLTESNFCKFFKKATGKTYSDYLNELRINEACRLLVQSDKSIIQISFDCGFETLSYFNRVFLNKKGVTFLSLDFSLKVNFLLTLLHKLSKKIWK